MRAACSRAKEEKAMYVVERIFEILSYEIDDGLAKAIIVAGRALEAVVLAFII
jgi:hypothetical protein